MCSSRLTRSQDVQKRASGNSKLIICFCGWLRSIFFIFIWQKSILTDLTIFVSSSVEKKLEPKRLDFIVWNAYSAKFPNGSEMFIQKNCDFQNCFCQKERNRYWGDFISLFLYVYSWWLSFYQSVGKVWVSDQQCVSLD